MAFYFVATTASNNSVFDLAPGPFLLYTNFILPRSQLFSTCYQYVNLVVGVVTFTLPLLRSLYIWSRAKISKRRERHRIAKAVPLQPQLVADVKQAAETKAVFERLISSFCYHIELDSSGVLKGSYDLHIVDLQVLYDVKVTAEHPGCKIFGNLTEASWNESVSAASSLCTAAQGLCARIAAAEDIHGIAVSTSLLSKGDMPDLLKALAEANIAVILLEDCEAPKASHLLHMVCGVLYKNGCILPNGMRRDFFQAATLRKALAESSYEREIKPTMLIGFLDLWQTRPHPATIRRSVKFSKFHDAVLYQACSTSVDTSAPFQAALSAFDILKREDFIEAQKGWVQTLVPEYSSNALSEDKSLQKVESVIPGITEAFKCSPYQPSDWDEFEPLGTIQPPQYRLDAPKRQDYWTTSSTGKTMCVRGCYDLRDEMFDEQYLSVLDTQLHLLRINMLTELPIHEAERLQTAISKLPESATHHKLLMQLSAQIESKSVLIYQGFDTGFMFPDQKGHFWAVTHENEKGNILIFVSLKTADIPTTIVHAYLAQLGIARESRFDCELELLSAGFGRSKHPRIYAELALASQSELLTMMQQLNISRQRHTLLGEAHAECERLLIEEPSRTFWVRMNSRLLLGRKVTHEEVFQARVDYLWTRGYHNLPSVSELTTLYDRVNATVLDSLLQQNEEQIETLLTPVLARWNSESKNADIPFDVTLDFYGLIIICIFRRHAFEEVYLECTDRCPLFLQQQDQAGVFSELWVLGSQCEVYFGIRPKGLGAIIYDRYQEYLREYEPPLEAWDNVNVFSAYSKVELSADDLAPPVALTRTAQNLKDAKENFIKTGYLAIFCLPAIIDVGLLTFLGRGLYLTAFMTLEERVMANYALLASLIMTAGITGWSGSVGGFYLYQSAFQNMNYFMVQRLSGGAVIASILAVAGFVRFGLMYSWYAGFIFVAYIMALSTYLNLLGIMATMHRDGSPFPSGRGVFGKCLCITLISPVVTTFFNNHDMAIYLPVLYLFLAALLYNYSKLCRTWTTWPELVMIIKESDIIKWHEEFGTKMNDDPADAKPGPREPPKTKSDLAAESLAKAVDSASKAGAAVMDPFLEKVVAQHQYVLWILKKESDGRPLPPPYCTTWLVQTKLALANQQQLNRGLKEHSPFLLFRYAKYDLAQNVGLFLVALLDRWVSISTSANGFVVDLYYNARARYGIAFALLYFLLCAISLDIVLQRYWGFSGRQSSRKLRNIFDLEDSEKEAAIVQKSRWIKAFTELISVMLCMMGFMTVLLFLFVIEARQIISYYAYILAYSGVIVAQFNRVFTTDIRKHVHIVFMGAALGYVVGVVLHEIPSMKLFPYNDVIALCSASLPAAWGTWLYTDFCDDVSDDIHIPSNGAATKSYAQRLVGYGKRSSELDLSPLSRMNSVKTYAYGDKTLFADDMYILLHSALQRLETGLLGEIENARDAMLETIESWKNGTIVLNVVSRAEMLAVGISDRFATSVWQDGMLQIYLGMPDQDDFQNVTKEARDRLLVQVAVEALIHETCEAILNMSHADATLFEMLVNGGSSLSTRIATQLAWTDESSLQEMVYTTNTELLRHLSFGIDLDTSWDEIPEHVRKVVIARVAGRPYTNTELLQDWILKNSRQIPLLDLSIKQCLAIYQVASWRLDIGLDPSRSRFATEENPETGLFTWSLMRRAAPQTLLQKLQSKADDIYFFAFTFVEYIAVVSTAGTDCGKELFYMLPRNRARQPILWAILKIWKLCSWTRDFWMRLLLLNSKPIFKKYQELYNHGVPRILTRGTITVQDPLQPVTGFLQFTSPGFELSIHKGALTTAPSGASEYQQAYYSEEGRLQKLHTVSVKDEVKAVSQEYQFSYSAVNKSKSPIPTSRTNTTNGKATTVYYDSFGRITHGSSQRGDRTFDFIYTYEIQISGSEKLLKAKYTSTDDLRPVIYEIFWCTTRDTNSFDPRGFSVSERVQKVHKTTSECHEEIEWNWSHKRDPMIVHKFYSTLRHELLKTEKVSSWKDEFGSFAKPTVLSFKQEDLLFYHQAKSSSLKKYISHSKTERKSEVKVEDLQEKQSTLPHISGFAAMGSKTRLPKMWKTVTSASIWQKMPGRLNVSRCKTIWTWLITPKATRYAPISTWKIRTALWKEWTGRTDLDACTCCFIDEQILRYEESLTTYWNLRDVGSFARAKEYLNDNMHAILAAVELLDDVAQKVSLSIRLSDLFVMGVSKDANFVTPAPESSFIDEDDRLAVIFTDTGCWPDAPGGVSNCRRDLIDGHTTIRNYALSESANEFGIPRFQIERSMQAIKNLPLWGLDGKSPYHGLFDNLLQSQVDIRLRQTTTEDIQNLFIPLLRSFIRGSRSHRFSKADLIRYTQDILKMNKYFEDHDYLKSWQCKETRQAFKEAWLEDYDDPNIRSPNDAFLIQQPTALNFDEAMGLWISYFFVLSVKIPENAPRVYQSTHHGLSSLWGMCLKLRRGTTWGIWDHAILWRESCLNISVAQCILPVSVQTMLLGAMKVATHLAYMHADTILPCTAIYNPIWEVELGTDEGRRQSQNVFLRKIDPVTNGISSMDAFKPVEKIKSEHPTAVMLSNVQFIKDVKNAILASSVIINDFGFKTYHLTVYGAQDREPSYAIKTADMINSLGVSKNVKLGGFGRPAVVLQEAWLFMNSSLSEGLPLAIGEAALSGCPIVATEVGATAQVLTDIYDENIRYGEVVPPNDPVALARAQIAILSMVGPWAKYTTDDVPPRALPSKFTTEDVEYFTKRMHDKTEDRRKLGLKLREVVLAKFNGNRYLREHEQMYWTHRHIAKQRDDEVLRNLQRMHPSTVVVPKFVEVIDNKKREAAQRKSLWDDARWQDF